MSKQKNNTTMSHEQTKWLRDFSDAKGGVSQASKILGLSRDALTRAVAGLPVHRGTAALLTQQIAERSKKAS